LDRYVLLWILDGEPRAVQPVRDLRHGHETLRQLLDRDGPGWFLFDSKAEKVIEPEAAFAMAS
jgi:hypothetical protein